MKVTPVSDILGAEVTGINLSQPLNGETLEGLRDAFLRYQVLVIRDQNMSPLEQVAFSKQFGDLEIPDNVDHTSEDSRNVMILSNEIREDGTAVGVVDGGDFWHSDSSHHDVPSMITILQSVTNPEKGGDTEFCNMYAVYDALPEDLKQKIDGLYAIHHVSKTVNKRVTISPSRPGAKDFYELQAKNRHEVVQPLVLTHPVTGRKALYTNSSFTAAFEGKTQEESLPLLEKLWEHSITQEFTCRLRWKKGSLAIWDNRCCMHYATSDYPGHRRHMRRIVLEGERPV